MDRTTGPESEPRAISLASLVSTLGGEAVGDASWALRGCATLEDAGPDELSFVIHPRYLGRVPNSAAGCLLVGKEHAARWPGRTRWVHPEPYVALRGALRALHGDAPLPEVGISPDAGIAPNAQVGELCTIRPGAYVAPRANLGRRVVVYPNVYVGKGAVIGDDCVLHPGVCVYAGCVLGQRVTLHANTVIGQDGFGYATTKLDGDDTVKHHRLPAVGNAVVEDDVEMGANCSIDRATLGSTVIGRGTKFSNNVVIGHGCKIGPHNLFVAGVGIAGSTTTGSHVTMGGHVGVAGHLTLGNRVTIAASSNVMHDIPEGETWGGTPAQPLTQAKRVLLQQQRLPELAATVKKLEKRVWALEQDAGNA